MSLLRRNAAHGTGRLFGLVAALLILALSGAALARSTLVLESWRDDDRTVWHEKIIPAFEAAHPGIGVRFRPSAPADYDRILKARLESGSAGDLIACRPFDSSLALYKAGHLADLSELAGMAHFSAVAKSAWQTDDGSVTFCVPIGSVIHGFLYNREAFRELGLGAPETEAAFFAILERLREDGSRIPMALGLRDRWEAATMGYDNIGPNYWKGEDGRRALVAGEQRLTDEQWAAPFRTLAKWRRYLGERYEARSYTDSQDLFIRGRAAIYPAGSWELAGFNARAGFEMGAFRPPVREAGDSCYISDHLDKAIGLNAASPNRAAARAFLNWVASAQFASLYATALPGFFPLSDHPVEIDDPLAGRFCHGAATAVRPSVLRPGSCRAARPVWHGKPGMLPSPQFRARRAPRKPAPGCRERRQAGTRRISRRRSSGAPRSMGLLPTDSVGADR